MKTNSRNIFRKRELFGQMDILHVVLEKEQAMRLYNSTLRVKDSGAHSWSKLKTCTFSEQEKNKWLSIFRWSFLFYILHIFQIYSGYIQNVTHES